MTTLFFAVCIFVIAICVLARAIRPPADKLINPNKSDLQRLHEGLNEWGASKKVEEVKPT